MLKVVVQKKKKKKAGSCSNLIFIDNVFCQMCWLNERCSIEKLFSVAKIKLVYFFFYGCIMHAPWKKKIQLCFLALPDLNCTHEVLDFAWDGLVQKFLVLPNVNYMFSLVYCITNTLIGVNFSKTFKHTFGFSTAVCIVNWQEIVYYCLFVNSGCWSQICKVKDF